MALVTNFEDRVIDTAGTLDIADNNAFEQSLADGCYDVIKRVENIPDELSKFTEASANFTSAISVNQDAIYDIVAVTREGRPARRIDSDFRYDITDSTSMYYVGEDDDPVWYIFDNILEVKPAVDAGPSYYYFIPIPSFTNPRTTQGASSIANFPRKYYEHVVTYAIIERLKARKLELLNNPPEPIVLPAIPELPTVPELGERELVRLELPELPDINLPSINVDLGSVKPGAMYWLEEEEDTEMVTSQLSILSKEIEVYAKDYDKAKAEFDRKKDIWEKECEFATKNHDVSKEEAIHAYEKTKDELDRFDKDLSAYNAALTSYTNQMNGLSKVYDEKFGEAKQNYEWLNDMIMQWTRKYEGLWGNRPQAQGGQQ